MDTNDLQLSMGSTGVPDMAGELVTQKRCGHGGCQNLVRTRLFPHDIMFTECSACGHKHAVSHVAAKCENGLVKECLWCGGREFFVRKDFPQKVGMAMVIIFGLIASVFYYYENVIATFATLGSLVVVDAVIYLFVGPVTVCYKCRAEYRGVGYNADHEGFDLATSEKYSHP